MATFIGTNGSDTITGLGSEGNVIEGRGGNDTLNGRGNNDRILGESGDDKIYGNGGDDRLEGGAGNDELYGGTGNDRMFGGDGSDELYGGTGNDTMYSGAGNSDDQMFGEDGDDVMYVESAAAGVLTNADGGYGNDAIYLYTSSAIGEGGYGNDTLYAYSSSNAEGGAGNDTLYAYQDSTVEGGGDDDQLYLTDLSKGVDYSGNNYFQVANAQYVNIESGAGNDFFNLINGNVEIRDYDLGETIKFTGEFQLNVVPDPILPTRARVYSADTALNLFTSPISSWQTATDSTGSYITFY